MCTLLYSFNGIYIIYSNNKDGMGKPGITGIMAGQEGEGRKDGWIPVWKGLKMCGGSENKPWGIDIRWAILSYSIIYLTV